MNGNTWNIISWLQMYVCVWMRMGGLGWQMYVAPCLISVAPFCYDLCFYKWYMLFVTPTLYFVPCAVRIGLFIRLDEKSKSSRVIWLCLFLPLRLLSRLLMLSLSLFYFGRCFLFPSTRYIHIYARCMLGSGSLDNAALSKLLILAHCCNNNNEFNV